MQSPANPLFLNHDVALRRGNIAQYVLRSQVVQRDGLSNFDPIDPRRENTPGIASALASWVQPLDVQTLAIWAARDAQRR